MKSFVFFVLSLFLCSVIARWPPGFNRGGSSDSGRPPPPRRPRRRPGRHEREEEPEDKFVNSLKNNSMIEQLNFKTFDEFMKKERETIILFIDEEVEECQDIIPEFINLTKSMAKSFDSKKIAYVNATDEKYLVEKNRDEVFPTILFVLEEKEAARFEGFKNKDQIAMHYNYLLNYDSLIEVKTFREADSILEEEYVTIIAFLTTDDRTLLQAFQILLDDEGVNPKNFPQILVKGPQLMKKLGRPDYLNFEEDIFKYQNVIGVVKNYAIPEIKETYFMEFEPDIYKDDLDDEKGLIKKLKNYKDFIKKHAKTSVIECIRQENYNEVINLLNVTKPTVVFFLDISFEKQFRKLEIFLDETFYYIINNKTMKDSFNFLYANADQFSNDLSKTFMIKKLKFPLMMIQTKNVTLKQPNIYYLYDEVKKFKPENLINYLNTYNLSSKPIVVSENKPKSQEYIYNTDTIRILTGNTFAEEIESGERDYFVMFNHDENEISKQFIPTFKKIAENITKNFYDSTVLKFASFNIAKNYLADAYKYELSDTFANLKFYLPKLFYFKKEDSKNPIRYKERKNENDIIHFLFNMVDRKPYDGFGEEVREIYELKLRYGVKVDPLPPILGEITIDIDELRSQI